MRPGAATAAVAIVAAAFSARLASADEQPAPRNNNLTVSVVGYGPTATYTRATRWISVGASMTYLPGGIESYALVGGAIVLTAHPAGSSNPRLFIEASGQIYRAFDVDAAPGEHADALALGVAVGWRWTWRSGVNAGIGAGAAYFFDASNPCDGRCVMTDEGVELRPFLDGGYAF